VTLTESPDIFSFPLGDRKCQEWQQRRLSLIEGNVKESVWNNGCGIKSAAFLTIHIIIALNKPLLLEA
jgi:hypothetical protein